MIVYTYIDMREQGGSPIPTTTKAYPQWDVVEEVEVIGWLKDCQTRMAQGKTLGHLDQAAT